MWCVVVVERGLDGVAWCVVVVERGLDGAADWAVLWSVWSQMSVHGDRALSFLPILKLTAGCGLGGA